MTNEEQNLVMRRQVLALKELEYMNKQNKWVRTLTIIFVFLILVGVFVMIMNGAKLNRLSDKIDLLEARP